ncbi:MAG: esterase/lipase family protein [Candidatus Rokuibacteriota bacterium]
MPSGGLRTIALLLLILMCAACASSPVGVARVDPSDVHRRLTRSALSTGDVSTFTRNILLEANLADLFDDDPEKALERLHDLAVSGSGGPGHLFAAAEASFLHAERTGQLPYHLAAALYAWAYLFPEDSSETPSPFDPHFQLAANLYNRGLTSALELAKDRQFVLQSGALDLPFGQLVVAFDPSQLVWQGRRMTAFTPIAEFAVFGLQAHSREPGIGAPLAALLAPLEKENRPSDLLRAELTLPVTVLLRAPRSRAALAWPPLTATLEIHVPEVAESVDVGGRQVPLETEPTAVLAYSLADSPIWRQEYLRFFQALPFGRDEQSELYATVPHRRGRIPVVFVHGTASSFGRWAEMYNRLAADPRLRARYEFWFFSYDSGAPIPWSAMLLRESLEQAVNLLDPGGTDPGLRRMVVIGHSQGGLLTKRTAIDSGSRLWDVTFKRPLESLEVSPQTRDVLRRTRFVTPLPFVKRVVFLATPHRGSELTVGRIAKWVTGFIKAPFAVAETFTDLVTRNRDALVLSSADAKPRLGTSLDQMNPRNGFLRTLAGIPLAPGVAANSIIAVKGSGPVEDGEDGVVAYRNARLDGVESELVVRSGHSLQDQPATVEEVRRILLLHARDVP